MNGQLPFARGFLVSAERDEAVPLKFNGTYIGANHGAFFGVALPVGPAVSIGSEWTDQKGAGFRVVSLEKGIATFISSEHSLSGSWKFKTVVDGDLTEVGGGAKLSSKGQSRAQIYPSVRRVSISVRSDKHQSLAEEFKAVSKVSVDEVYDVLSPTKERSVMARVSVAYVFQGNGTTIQTTVRAVQDLHGFSLAGAQIYPLNASGTDLLQRVESGEQLSSWTAVGRTGVALRIATKQHSASQRIEMVSFQFGHSAVVRGAALNGKPLPLVERIDVSAVHKQYLMAIEGGAGGFSGNLRAGDVVTVSAYRSYWTGKEPPASAF
ncbi:hypothetical protein [Pseudomonas sp. Q11]|uniref:hypothetical protein n=1 Tax=Pseudomonas sp. Q11 TaxID=2968470 RepID=UPI00210CF692|nr:hypothetical protein [Pseudomonas sp. Q11]MCQ6258206.1 hypothetical protein [Pseudomonas sp. Q11]